VECGSRNEVFSNPKHPYTQVLLRSTPRIFEEGRVSEEGKVIIKGEMPSPMNPPSGCAFHKRCPHVMDKCRVEAPVLQGVERRGEGSRKRAHEASCHLLQEN